jgi:hypothetical protein
MGWVLGAHFEAYRKSWHGRACSQLHAYFLVILRDCGCALKPVAY